MSSWRYSCISCSSTVLYFSNREKIATCRKCGKISNKIIDKNIDKKVLVDERCK